MKINIFVIGFALMILSFASCKQFKTSEQVKVASLIDDDSLDTHSMLYYERLMSSFNSNWKTEEPAASDYPEYFGGAFIENNGVLVVCIVENQYIDPNIIAGIIGTDNFLTESCTFSYRKMMEVMDLIDVFLSNPSVPEDHIVIQYFAGAMADVLENRVVVNMVEVTPEVIKAFKQDISDSDVVLIQQGEIPEFD